VIDMKDTWPQRFLNSGARGPEFESRRAYQPPFLESITYGLPLVCHADPDLLLLPHFPASSDKELTSNPTGGSNPARAISFAGGGVDIAQHAVGVGRCHNAPKAASSRWETGGDHQEALPVRRDGVNSTKSLRTAPMAGERPARQQQEPNRDTKGRACPAGQRGVLPAARASVPNHRVGAGARGATPLPSHQYVAVTGPAPDGGPGSTSFAGGGVDGGGNMNFAGWAPLNGARVRSRHGKSPSSRSLVGKTSRTQERLCEAELRPGSTPDIQQPSFPTPGRAEAARIAIAANCDDPGSGECSQTVNR